MIVSKEDLLIKTNVVYKISNNFNDKVYIGSTINFRKRVGNYTSMVRRKDIKGHPKLIKSILKHGSENFKVEVIEKVEDFSKLMEREQFYLDTLFLSKGEEYFKKYSYNICKIAGTCKGRKMTEAQKEHLRKVNTGKKASLEARENMRKSSKGIPPLVNGEKHPRAVLNEKLVLKLREEYKNGVKVYELVKKYNFKYRAIFCAVKGQTWKHLNN